VELSWTTFILEIVNFLLLVWILKRFLYKPVLDVIARRQAGIEKTLADAKGIREEAEDLKAQYEGRLSEWDAEKAQARDDLHKEIEGERKRLLEKLNAELDTEREKARAIEERRAEDERRGYEETALAHGASFAARLLSQVADEGLQRKLVALALEQIKQLPDDRTQLLRSAFENGQHDVTITTAFELSPEDRTSIQQRLSELLGDETQFEYVRDDHLKAGIRIGLGSWTLRANLEDELKAFVESIHERG
jgi:F-type H+-transporting ATPase subunit b